MDLYDIVVCFFGIVTIGILVVKWWRKSKEKSEKTQNPSKDVQRPPNDKYMPEVIIAEGEIELLEKMGFVSLLMRDYSVLPALSRKDLHNKSIVEKKLKVVLNDILLYLNLPLIVQLCITYEDNDNQDSTEKTHAGKFTSDLLNKEIVLKIRNDYEPINVLAVLCHECTHFFMEYHKLNWSDKDLNEVRTDVTANLIGFNGIMERGYEPIVTVKTIGNIVETNTQKIGYISTEACREIGFVLFSFRAHKQKELEKSAQIESIRKKLGESLKVAMELAFHLECIDIRSLKVTGEASIQSVQQALLEYESRNVKREIENCKTTFEQSQDSAQLKSSLSKIDSLCGELLRWSSIFQMGK